MPIVFTAPSGKMVSVDPDLVESVRPSPEGIHVRMLNGVTQIVRESYLSVLERLAAL